MAKQKTEPVKEATVDQQATMIQEEIQRFVQLAKGKGYLTVAEIDELLPQEIIAASVLDSFMQGLEVNGVVVTEEPVEGAEEDEVALFVDPAQEEEDEDEEAGEDDVKGNDPVRLYLRKMGSVSLLTREGEVEIAKRIEQGERQIVRAILLSPIGTREIIQLGDRVDQGRLKVKAIFRGLEDEDTQYDEKEYIDKIHELIGEVSKYEKKVKKSFETLRQQNLDPAKKAAAQKQLEVLNDSVMSVFESINFNRKTINRVVIKFRNLVNRMTDLRKRIREATQYTFTNGIEDLEAKFKHLESNEKEMQKFARETGLTYNKLRSYYTRAKDAQRRLDRLHDETQMNFE